MKTPAEFSAFVTHSPRTLSFCCPYGTLSVPASGLVSQNTVATGLVNGTATGTFADGFGGTSYLPFVCQAPTSGALRNGADMTYGSWVLAATPSYTWQPLGTYAACTNSCEQLEDYECVMVDGGSSMVKVPDAQCTSPKPTYYQSCTGGSCVQPPCYCLPGYSDFENSCAQESPTQVTSTPYPTYRVVSPPQNNCVGLAWCWSSFMEDHAIWISPEPTPNTSEIGVTYIIPSIITVSTAGNYVFEGSADDTGSVTFDTTTFALGGFNAAKEGTVFLTAGTHQMSFSVENLGNGTDNSWDNNPAGVAMVIYDPSGTVIYDTANLPQAYVMNACPSGYTAQGATCVGQTMMCATTPYVPTTPTACASGGTYNGDGTCTTTQVTTIPITSNALQNVQVCNDNSGYLVFSPQSGTANVNVTFLGYDPQGFLGWNCWGSKLGNEDVVGTVNADTVRTDCDERSLCNCVPGDGTTHDWCPGWSTFYGVPENTYVVGTLTLTATNGMTISNISSIGNLTYTYSSHGSGCSTLNPTQTSTSNGQVFVDDCGASGAQEPYVSVQASGNATITGTVSYPATCPTGKTLINGMCY